MWIADLPVQVKPTLEDAAGSVFLRPAQLLNSLFGMQPGQNGYPPQAPVRGGAFLSKPAIIGRGERPFRLSIVRVVTDEEGRENYLNIDTQLVHLMNTARHVLEFAPRTRRMIYLVAYRTKLKPVFNQPPAAVCEAKTSALRLLRGKIDCQRNILCIGRAF